MMTMLWSKSRGGGFVLGFVQRSTHHHHHHHRSSSMKSIKFFSTLQLFSSNNNNNNNSKEQQKKSYLLFKQHYDVIIVGGGHAGCEAAAASARMGAKTALITQKLSTIGELSCNPSIGGIGKGHLVREMDALGGIMGNVADYAGIHYRMLNRRKGPAVRGPRAQMDRDLYKEEMQKILQSKQYSSNLSLLEASVEDLLFEERTEGLVKKKSSTSTTTTTPSSSSSLLVGGTFHHGPTFAKDDDRKAHVHGVLVKTIDNDTGIEHYHEVTSNTVVITTGTFLRGVLMMGLERYSGGRHLRDSEEVEEPSVGLAQTFSRFQFPLGRLKTGTPARLDGTTINYDLLPKQPTENPAIPFSYHLQYKNLQPPNLNSEDTTILCHQSHTNERTHELVMKYEHLLPKYDGNDGEGTGPRYCPSIYKKVQRFSSRSSHNCFLEPEGLHTNIVYPNGMSGPYPPKQQEEILRTMIGMENVEIIRPGYDVEYDYINPLTSLTHSLETKSIQGLYLAGQICGTTGYEEAAAQGILAGSNAALQSMSNSDYTPLIIGRDEGYIGVLVDDLVTRGTTEPYRMFTSRAEYRISLRADNADLRLTQKGYEYGLLSSDNNRERMELFHQRQESIEKKIQYFHNFSLKWSDWNKYAKEIENDNENDTETETGDDTAKFIHGGTSRRQQERKTAEQILSMPHVTLNQVERIIEKAIMNEKEEKKKTEEEHEIDDHDAATSSSYYEPTPPCNYDTVEASIKYGAYMARQTKDMESWRKAQGVKIPPTMIYSMETLPTLKTEELEKLSKIRPNTVAEASQIPGITPQALVYIYEYITKQEQKRTRRKQREEQHKQQQRFRGK